MKRVFYPIIACLLSLSCQGQQVGFRSVSVDEFAQAMSDSAVVLLDVRTADEHKAGYIEGTALQIDVLKSDFDSLATVNIRKGSTIALYCRSGNRSKRAASALVAKGFRVIELSTGYNGWVQAGKPVVIDEE